MKKAVKIILVVLAVLVLLGAGVCWWQWDNIQALKMSLDTPRQDLSQMMEANNQRVDEVSNQLPVTVRDLTEEEKEALRQGLMDRDELLDRLIGKEPVEESPAPSESQAPADSQPEEPEQTEAPEETKAPEQTTQPEPSGQPESSAPAEPSQSPEPEVKEETNEEKLSRYIAEIYLMKSEYTAWLEDAYEACIAEYTALPEEERTYVAKYELGMAYMRTALQKEDECDARMAELEGKIREVLVEMGGDTSLVDEIHAAYEEEKALKKAYYLGLHD